MQQFVFTVQFPQNRLQTITWLTVRVDSINSCLLSLTLHLCDLDQRCQNDLMTLGDLHHTQHIWSYVTLTSPLSDLTSLYLWLYFWPVIMYDLLTLFDLKQTWHMWPSASWMTSDSHSDFLCLKKLRKKLDFSVRKFWAAFYKGTLWLGLKTSHSCGMIAVNQLLFACEKFGEVCKSLIVMNISWRKPNPCHTIVITTPVLIRLGREH